MKILDPALAALRSLTTLLALAPLLSLAPQEETAPAAPAEAKGVSELYRPGEESSWVFEQAGERVGDHRFRYDGPVDLEGRPAHRFSGWIRVRTPTPVGELEQRIQAELWTDEAGHALRQVLQVAVRDTYTRLEVRVDGDRAHVEISGAQTREIDAEISPEAYLQTNNFIGYFELLYRLARPESGGKRDYRLFSSNVLQEFPYQVSWKERFASGESESAVQGDVWQDSLGEVLTVADDGRLMTIRVDPQQLLIRRTDEELLEFTVAPPAPVPVSDTLSAEEVTIRYDDVSLAGTVMRPKSAGPDAKLPAVFFISGSGPQDRNGLSSGIDVGTHEILDHLTEAGFLTLRVDDRGVGASTGPLEDMGFDELVADARACVDWLFAREDVDPTRIALIGHSEGGVTAPILAAERPEIAAVVLMAAAGRSMPDIIYEQNEAMLADSDLSEGERKAALEEVRRFMDEVRSGADPDPANYSPEFGPMIANLSWLRDHAAQDPERNIARVKCPVLILQGAEDLQVSPERDARTLDEALTLAGNQDHELHVFEGLDHLFKHTTGETSKLTDYAVDRPVDEHFLEVLTDWLSKRMLSK